MEKYIAAAITFTGAILFGMGYTYLNSYFAWFQISFHEVNPSVQDILAFSAVVLSKIISLSWPALAALTILVTLASHERISIKLHEISVSGRAALFTFSTLMLGWAGISYSATMGAEHAEIALNSARQQGFWIEGDTKAMEVISDLTASKYNSNMHFFYATDKTLFILITYAHNNNYSIVRIPKDTSMKFGTFRER